MGGEQRRHPIIYELDLNRRHDTENNLKLVAFPEYTSVDGLTYRKEIDTIIHPHGKTKRMVVYKPLEEVHKQLKLFPDNE